MLPAGHAPKPRASKRTAVDDAFDHIERLAAATGAPDGMIANPAPTRHPRKVAAAIERVIASAQAHGEQSDPEHEAGDLGAFLRIFAKHAPAAAIEAAVREFFGTHDDWTEV
jgi:hypothetical protein